MKALLALALLCPLFDWPGAGFDGLRRPAVLLLSALLLGGLALEALKRRERAVEPSPILLAGLALLAIQLLSLSLSTSPWDGAGPVMTLAAGLAVFAACGRAPRAWATGAILAAAIAVSALGIGQALRGQEAVSTEGNRNYAGELAAMLLPFAAPLVTAPGLRRGLAGPAALGALALLVLSGSRGGMLAAFIGCAAAAVAVGRGRPGFVPALGGVLAVGAVIGLQAQTQLAPDRLETVTVRSELWLGAGKIAIDRPILGSGPGNFAVHYPSHRSYEEARVSHRYRRAGFVEAEDPHSSWMQTLSETGFAGLLAFLAVALLAARAGVRSLQGTENRALVAGCIGAAVSYLVGGAFNSLTLHASHTLLFWAFLGLMQPPAASRPSPAGGVLTGLTAAALALASWAALSMGRAEVLYTHAMKQGGSRERREALEAALRVHSAHWKSRSSLAAVHLAEDRLAEGEKEARAVLETRPHHAPALNNLAVALLRSGREKEGEEVLRRALRDAPHCYLTSYNLGSLQLRRKLYADAEKHFRAAWDFNKWHTPTLFSLGEVLMHRSYTPGALRFFRDAWQEGMDVRRALLAEHPEWLADPAFAEFR